MTAAAARAALAEIGRDLVALAGDPGARRAAALITESAPTCASFADLSAAPAWLRLPREAQGGIARRAALLAMAPALAASIDGAWLRALADAAGEDRLDWAIAQADAVPGGGLAAIPAADLEAAGFALLRATLPEALAGYLTTATYHQRVDRALAAFCVARAIGDRP